jgi:hypothetical protein
LTRSVLITLLALALGVSLGSPAAAQTGKWERINREDGITVFKKTIPGSDLIAVKGETTIKQPLAKVLSVFMTHERWGEWVSRMKNSKILKTTSTYDYVIYQAFKLPFFVSDRDYVYHGRVSQNAKGQVILTMVSCTSELAPETCGVRAELINSRYVLTPKGKSQTTVEVEIHTDPKGLIPAWLVNQLQKSWPVGTLNGVRDQARRKDVEPFPLPPVTAEKAVAKGKKADAKKADAKKADAKKVEVAEATAGAEK